MENTWQKVQNRIKSLDKLYKRMDATKGFLYMDDYKLKYFNTEQELKNVINVTGNKGAVHVERIVEMLMDSEWQTVVKGSISKRQAYDIEQFLEDNLEQIDDYLLEEYGIPGLKHFLSRHICARGIIGAEILLYIENGEYKIHCMPTDMRWTPYVINNWACPITYWSASELEVEIEKYAKLAESKIGEFKKKKISGNDIEVRDYWDKEKHELWIAEEQVYSVNHNLGKPPFVIVIPASGFMLRDKGYQEHEGEDALFLIKKLIDHDNMQLSIEQTRWMESIMGAFERGTKNMDSKPTQPVPKAGETIKVTEGEEAKLVQRYEMGAMEAAARQDISGQIDDGAPLSPRAYNSPPSGVTVATEVELLNQLQKSRIDGLRVFREQACRLIIDQFRIIADEKGEYKIGRQGLKRTWSVAKVKDPSTYTISCQLMTKNKRMEIVNESRALALRGWLPDEFIFENVLMVDDPSGLKRMSVLQKAEQANPAISLFEMGLKYTEEAENMEDSVEAELKKWEAMTLIDEGIRIQRQRMMPQMETGREEQQIQKAVEQRGNAQGLMAMPKLLGETTGRQQAQPRQEVEVGT